jgi:hypothetical protein
MSQPVPTEEEDVRLVEEQQGGCCQWRQCLVSTSLDEDTDTEEEAWRYLSVFHRQLSSMSASASRGEVRRGPACPKKGKMLWPGGGTLVDM